ncbi:bifunctional glycosyltransferase family 2/GtrA family protein [Salimicrobium humidisoli]|uniref:bifunctional glycosyltransferase family 2/GtrA family protein n=1 Tax=Salimicrobium humidisoli TaxID=2029857 RepID=UPI001E601F1A|nr:bifunctional glycosyltransferase family 2/GtrA family protein [Salimicrobium humidisoli]
MSRQNGISIVIPAFDPDDKLIDTVKNISDFSFDEIIVVNDGSDVSTQPIFDEVTKFPQCTVLNHSVNMGKGRALKTAFSYYTEKNEGGIGLITADADGQHSPDDIKKVAEKLQSNPEDLILGVRDFSGEDIPLRSRFGNKLTKIVLRVTSGMSVTDTQTGLRGIPSDFAEELLHLEGDRYEFEMKMILACKNHNRGVKEVTIDTIYIDENESSHFNPIVDSIKIYYVFFRFLLTSVASFIVDIGLFAVFSSVLKVFMQNSFIIIATVLARILSSMFNYFVNKKLVFKSSASKGRSLVKYYILAAFQMSASALGVHAIYQSVGDHEVLIKIGVDSILFLLSFLIQKKWVF